MTNIHVHKATTMRMQKQGRKVFGHLQNKHSLQVVRLFFCSIVSVD